MTEKNNGGPAFPIAFQHHNVDGSISGQEWGGMMLRDYLAAKAMQGILANDVCMKQAINEATMGAGVYKATVALIAKRSYDYADAMLAAREQ